MVLGLSAFHLFFFFFFFFDYSPCEIRILTTGLPGKSPTYPLGEKKALPIVPLELSCILNSGWDWLASSLNWVICAVSCLSYLKIILHSRGNEIPVKFLESTPLQALNNTETTLHIDITRWLTPKSDWLYSLQLKMERLSGVSKNKTRSWLWLRSWTPYCQIQT